MSTRTSIAKKTLGTFELDERLGYLANSLVGDDVPSLPAEFVDAARAPDPVTHRTDLTSATVMQVAVAFGHAFALARLEEPFGTEGDWLETADEYRVLGRTDVPVERGRDWPGGVDAGRNRGAERGVRGGGMGGPIRSASRCRNLPT